MKPILINKCCPFCGEQLFIKIDKRRTFSHKFYCPNSCFISEGKSIAEVAASEWVETYIGKIDIPVELFEK